MPNKLTNEEVTNRCIEARGNEFDCSLIEYKNAQTKISVKCRTCGLVNNVNLHNFLKGSKCPQCSLETCRKYKTKSLESFLILQKKIHGDRYSYISGYEHRRSKIHIKCNSCNEIFIQIARNHISNMSGCSKCQSSKGEILITNWLTNLQINFEKEKTFDKCYYERPLRFDFYLPYYNICIEFDGAQHFSSCTRFGGESIFTKIQTRDEIKNQFCISNNIRLIRISYHQMKDVNRILNKEILNIE